MNREQLLKNEGYWMSKIQLDLFNQLDSYMKENNINQSQFAKKLGVSKGYVSQILNGDFNHRISKFVELALAIDKIPEITFADINKVIKNEKEGTKTINWEVNINQESIFNQQSGRIEKTVPKEQITEIKKSYLFAS